MIQIKVPFFGTAVMGPGSPPDTFKKAMGKMAEATQNIGLIICGANATEQMMAEIIRHYFFGLEHDRKADFELQILRANWCSFDSKIKLVLHIVSRVMEKKEVEKFEQKLRKASEFRNAFAHGKLMSDGQKVWLCYFKAKNLEVEINDDAFREVEAALFSAFDATQEIAKNLGAWPDDAKEKPRA